MKVIERNDLGYICYHIYPDVGDIEEFDFRQAPLALRLFTYAQHDKKAIFQILPTSEVGSNKKSRRAFAKALRCAADLIEQHNELK